MPRAGAGVSCGSHCLLTPSMRLSGCLFPCGSSLQVHRPHNRHPSCGKAIRPPMPERTYAEEEVAAIFARAAERQRPASTREASTGLTLAEVEQAGVEAGLNPTAIRAAAAEVGIRQRFPTRPKVAVAERWIEAPIPAGVWEDLVVSLRHRLGASSAWWDRDTVSLGEAQEWMHTAASGVRTTVTLSPRGERTLLRVVQEDAGFEDDRQMGWLMAALLGLLPSLLAGALVAETLALGDFTGVAVVVLVLLTAVAFGGPLLAARVRNGRERQAERVRQIADSLADQIGGVQSQPTSDDSSTASAPQLDLSVLDAEVSPTPPQTERRRAKS